MPVGREVGPSVGRAGSSGGPTRAKCKKIGMRNCGSFGPIVVWEMRGDPGNWGDAGVFRFDSELRDGKWRKVKIIGESCESFENRG